MSTPAPTEKAMTTTALEFCVKALSLPRQTRAEIAEHLLSSLEDDESFAHTEALWRNEIRRRRDEIRDGKTKLRPADKVMRSALRAIA
ncbi:MAG TPA: addiction module protein [Verrucomicrobiae bacterium]|jgi:putative addiction module component (TIGR02574 family)|nr:addiction module protein [Verrucomicrobiae bacterium]